MKILIVDDSAVSRSHIRKELEAGGYEVEEAGSGKEALSLLPGMQPDLITMDLNMPELNGLETCHLVRNFSNTHPDEKGKICNVPVIIITQSDTPKLRVEGFKAGATDFLVKPFERESLLNLVNYILNHQGLPDQPAFG